MSGMLAVSKPPMIITDGLRRSQASVIGKKVCQEANQPNTTSARSTPRSTLSGFGTAARLVEVLDLVALGEDVAVDGHEARLAAVHVEEALLHAAAGSRASTNAACHSDSSSRQ